jgi:hypothetical protein
MAEPHEAESPKERVRRDLHRAVEDGVARMTQASEGGAAPFPPDFTERESRALAIGLEVGARLLGLNLAEDPVRRTVESAATWKCPRCGTDCPRALDAKGQERSEKATLKTRVGKIPLSVPLFACRPCRRVFSPLPTGREPRAGEL